MLSLHQFLSFVLLIDCVCWSILVWIEINPTCLECMIFFNVSLDLVLNILLRNSISIFIKDSGLLFSFGGILVWFCYQDDGCFIKMSWEFSSSSVLWRSLRRINKRSSFGVFGIIQLWSHLILTFVCRREFLRDLIFKYSLPIKRTKDPSGLG